MIHDTSRSLGVLVSIAPPLLLVVWLWAPVLAHYYVPGADIDPQAVAAARDSPTDDAFVELRSQTFGVPRLTHYNDAEILEAASGLLERRFNLPGWTFRETGFPFRPEDVEADDGVWQLRYASFLLPGVLLEAHERSGDDSYLLATRDFLLDWNRFERHRRLPRGFMWNDHALAARTVALADFWRLYRQHAAYSPDHARQVLELVVRTGQFLAKPSHYTYATNHGTFQTLALMHLALSFPTLDQFVGYPALAVERLTEQMAYLVAADGTVLEHSPEYHYSGLERMATAFRYLTLADIPIPDDWWELYARAMSLQAAMQRPDGSLPRIGDTGVMAAARGVLVTERRPDGGALRPYHVANLKRLEDLQVQPVGGHAIWWGGRAASDSDPGRQTVLNWQHFPGHAHEHAAELSVNLWSDGVEWITGPGYWPYGLAGRREAVSWLGHNAPHWVDEPADGERHSQLLAMASAPELMAADLQRTRGNGANIRRQVLQVYGEYWLIIDAFSDDRPGTVRTTWTFDPQLQRDRAGVVDAMETTLRHQPSSRHLRLAWTGSSGLQVERLHGSESPWGGWVVDTDRTPRAAEALRMMQQVSEQAWTALVVHLPVSSAAPPADKTLSTQMLAWDGPEEWSLAINDADWELIVERTPGGLRLQNGLTTEPTDLFEWVPAEASEEGRQMLRTAFGEAEKRYGPRFNDYIEFRSLITGMTIVLLLAQEVVMLLCKRLLPGAYMPLRTLSGLAWIALGVGVHVRYLL
ncbi:hypothetical protein J2T57_002960 [Natronocella acetinitrilica]|uniref:Heparin-sulfate lyase N-terminal domain-containing protein n=1 Tax=Natronocella acetinitrilica TaxID=414046 RepID=A0AAE3G4Q0_9GAMM|nr:heparinase II/III family protein [Natronocella acetinitrilica]MCP1675805.1 hypothetical protein [Natronocella acetinitrilica]